MLKRPDTIMTAAAAEALAAKLNADDLDGWTYRVSLSRDGRVAKVNVYDETGALVGAL